MGLYYKMDAEGNVSPADSPAEWGLWFEGSSTQVDRTQVGNYLVSTVFLGLDHGFGTSAQPILFETLVFEVDDNGETGNSLEDTMRRYSTRDEALAGHAETVQMIIEKEEQS